MSLSTIFEDTPARIHRSLSVSDALADARVRRRGVSDPFLNVEYSCYVQPPVIEKWKYVKHETQPKVNLDQPESLPPLVYIRSSWVDPAALGVFGFGMGALVISLQFLVPRYSISNGFHWIILLPGVLQVLSGLIDIQRGSYFGAITFIGYGLLIIGDGVTIFLETLFKDTTQDFTQFKSITGIGGIVFSTGTLLIAINMSAVYSLLLAITLATFILQTVASFYIFSPIPLGVLWGILAIIALYIFLAEIVNTVAERHIIPLGNAVFDYKRFHLLNPFT